MRANAWDTPCFRSCARDVLCWPAFPSAPSLGSTDSAAARAALFAGFSATMEGSDFSGPFIAGFNLFGLPDADRPYLAAGPEISRFPYKELRRMPGPLTTRSPRATRVDATRRLAFRFRDSVGTPDLFLSRLNLPAYTLPYRRFARSLAAADARLGANAAR